jgi:hypothetical protein
MFQEQGMAHLMGDGTAHVVLATQIVIPAIHASKILRTAGDTVSISRSRIGRVTEGTATDGPDPEIEVSRPVRIVVVLIVVDFIYRDRIITI